MWFEPLLVFGVLTAALAWLTRRLVRTLRSKKNCCGCSNPVCPADAAARGTEHAA